jgi:hypothetical protein
VLTAYWDDSLTLCGSCSEEIARRLDEADVWPPTRWGEFTIVIGASVPRYDGRELVRLYHLLHLHGARLHVTFSDDRPVLSFTEPMPLEAAEIAARHSDLLVSAWRHRERLITLCQECWAPFLLAKQIKSTCPVCGKGKRGTHVLLPFTDSPARKRRPA